MRYLDTFLIPHTGLKSGHYQYEYNIGTEFFDAKENEEIKGVFEVHLDFEKKPEIYILDFTIKGAYKADCDRCLNPIDVPLDGQFQQIVKFSDEEYGEDVFCLPPTETKLDVSPFIYDYIVLATPLIWRRECESEDYKYCNQDVLDTLENLSEEKKTNPIWDTLKDLNIKS